MRDPQVSESCFGSASVGGMTVAYSRGLSLEAKAVDGRLVGRSFGTPEMLFITFILLARWKDESFMEKEMGELASYVSR